MASTHSREAEAEDGAGCWRGSEAAARSESRSSMLNFSQFHWRSVMAVSGAKVTWDIESFRA